jgi:hypothetical protein
VGRGLLWFFLIGTSVGFVISIAIVVASLRPEPGANMVLMGLPLIAVPTALFTAGAVAVAGSSARLSRWERRAVYGAGGMVVAIFSALVILG